MSDEGRIRVCICSILSARSGGCQVVVKNACLVKDGVHCFAIFGWRGEAELRTERVPAVLRDSGQVDVHCRWLVVVVVKS